VAKKAAAKKPVAKKAVVNDDDAKSTPAKLARQKEKCGALEGGIDAYFYSDRCILKKKHDMYMRHNRRAAAFVNKATTEIPVLKRIEDTPVDDDSLHAALLDLKATEDCVKYVTSPDKMESVEDPEKRVAAAIDSLASKHPNIAKYPGAFKLLAARGARNSFQTAIDNYKEFRGRAATNKGGIKKETA
jgi:hypothetical protein